MTDDAAFAEALEDLQRVSSAREAERNETIARTESRLLDDRIRHLDRRFVTDRMLFGFGRGGRRGRRIATERVQHEERRSDLRSFLAGDLSWDEAQKRLFERAGFAPAVA